MNKNIQNLKKNLPQFEINKDKLQNASEIVFAIISFATALYVFHLLRNSSSHSPGGESHSPGGESPRYSRNTWPFIEDTKHDNNKFSIGTGYNRIWKDLIEKIKCYENRT